MPSTCLYLQMHQPPRLRRFNIFTDDTRYFDDDLNRSLLQRIAARCYDPTLDLLRRLTDRHRGDFRLGLSVSGSLLDQLTRHAPDTLERLVKLAGTGDVEILGETDHHSIASAVGGDEARPARREFGRQIDLHTAAVERRFGQRPTVFRNTELIHSDAIAVAVARRPQGFLGVLAEGADHVLGDRSPNHLYRAHGTNLGLLLRNHRLSDAIAFRFTNADGRNTTLTADAFAERVAAQPGEVVNLFMDFETFGEHLWASTGIFTFLERLPAALLDRGCFFLTPSEAMDTLPAAGILSTPAPTSWADARRDTSAWLGNAMQQSATQRLYALAPLATGPAVARHHPELLRDWRRLTTSDHVYYMATPAPQHAGDETVHQYFSPYDSPYDAYINFMNILGHLTPRLEAAAARSAD